MVPFPPSRPCRDLKGNLNLFVKPVLGWVPSPVGILGVNHVFFFFQFL